MSKRGWRSISYMAHYVTIRRASASKVGNIAYTAQLRTDMSYALRRAAQAGRTAFVLKLLDRGDDIDSAEDDGITALMFAAEGGHIDVVMLLIQYRADVHAVDVDGLTALELAEVNGHKDIADLMRAAGMNKNG